MKAISFEAILMLTEEQIAESFPLGIVAVAKDRWRPAVEGEEADKELGELVKAKYDRRERYRFMARDSTQTATESLVAALGSETHTTDAAEPEPEMVDEETLKRFSESAHLREETENVTASVARIMGERDALKAQMEARIRLAREKGMDIRSDVKVIERRIQALDRKLGLEEAA